MKHLFLVVSVILTLIGAVPYIKDIITSKTRPNLVSWVTWSILTAVATGAEISAHAYVTAIFTGAASVETISIVILGLRHGYVKYHWFDFVCQIGAIIGFILWWIFDSPTVAIIATVVIDFIGGLPTWRHAYNMPHEETWQTFAISGIGGVFTLLALSSFSWASLTYPIFIVFSCISITAIILFRSNLLAQQ